MLSGRTSIATPVVRRVALTVFVVSLELTGAHADPPASATYTYDDAGRLILGSFSDGKLVGYQYDAAGNRVSVAQGQPPQLTIAAASAAEGGTVVFTVTKTGTAAGTVTVDCAQTAGSAVAPADYTASTQTLTFLIADTTRTCSVVTVQDTIFEQNQTFGALLQNPTGVAIITTGSAIGTIIDNDPAPTFSIGNASVTEGGNLSFTITKSGSTELSHAVSYATADGTATSADADFTSLNAGHTFAAGETSYSALVATTADTKYEANETLTLTLSSPTNGAALGSPTQGTGTINNDETAPSFSINSPAAVNEGGLITFTITKGGNTSTGLAHSFNWATANNTAVAPGDYTTASGSITFQPTDSQKTVQVQLLTDGVVDSASNETFFVNLTTNAGTNGATLSGSQGAGTIADIDASVPSVPGNIRKSPTTGTAGNYSILWDASTGTVNHYTLEEVESAPGNSTTTYSVATTFKSMNKGQVYLEATYRVRACTTSTESQCSAYSGSVFKLVCPSTGCP
ncbi:MAG TPA: Calx-beta domain-containing protein [Steroidobacteraceae bacterium]|nr:Calx-beta domain-containing protein [Steroidobacteraceae bacterium]